MMAEVGGDTARLEQRLCGSSLPVWVREGEPGARAIAVAERKLHTR
jgi:hypothetical protein